MTGLSKEFCGFAQSAWQARAERLGVRAEGWEREIAAAGKNAPLLRYVLGKD